MAANNLEFRLVGARFSKLVVDEHAATSAGDSKELEVEITRSQPVVSGHLYGDSRRVIELRVAVSATHAGATSTVLDKVFQVECTAGFIGAEEADDGNLEKFSDAVESYARSVYWILRERLDSVFAVTLMRGIHLPWDLVPQESKPRDVPGPPPRRRAPRPKKKGD